MPKKRYPKHRLDDHAEEHDVYEIAFRERRAVETQPNDANGERPAKHERKGDRMRITSLVGVAIAATLALTGCGAQWTDTVSTPAAQSQPAPEPPPYTPVEQAYLDRLDDAGVYYADDQQAVDAARAICTHLAQGGSLMQATTLLMTKAGYSARSAGRFVDAAMSAFCPEQLGGA